MLDTRKMSRFRIGLVRHGTDEQLEANIEAPHALSAMQQACRDWGVSVGPLTLRAENGRVVASAGARRHTDRGWRGVGSVTCELADPG